MTTDLKDIFKKAKAELQTRGRTVGALVNEKGECCLLGAIGLAVGVSPVELAAENYEIFKPGGVAHEAASALALTIPAGTLNHYGYGEDSGYHDYGAVYTYNDEYARDADQDDLVYELLDRASA